MLSHKQGLQIARGVTNATQFNLVPNKFPSQLKGKSWDEIDRKIDLLRWIYGNDFMITKYQQGYGKFAAYLKR